MTDFDFDYSEPSPDTLRCPFCRHDWEPDVDEQLSSRLFEEGNQYVKCPSCRQDFPVYVRYTTVTWQSPDPIENEDDSSDKEQQA